MTISGIFSIRLPFWHPDGDGGGGGFESSEFAQDMAVLEGDVDEIGEKEEPDTDDSGEEDVEHPGRKREKKAPSKSEESDQAEPEEDEEEEDDEEEPEEDDDEEDDEEKDEEEKEGDKEKKVPVQGRPTVKDIKDRFPDFFKVLPGMRAVYFEHENYQKIFSTPEVAQEASRKAGEFDFLEDTLVNSSDPEPLFETLAQNNPRAFKSMIMKIPDALEKVDRNTFLEFTEPILERFVASMANHAKKTGDNNLLKVARHAANFAFANGGEIPNPTERRNGGNIHPAEAQLQKEREEHATREHNRAASTINDRVKASIRELALEGVPRETSDFIKRGLIRDLTTEIDATLGKDRAFAQHMAGLWRKARTAQYSSESTEGIYNAWTSRAKPLLRDIARRLRSEALGKSVKPRVNGDTESREENPNPRKKHFRSSQKVSGKSGHREVLDPHKIDYRRTTDMDILEGRVKLKGQR